MVVIKRKPKQKAEHESKSKKQKIQGAIIMKKTDIRRRIFAAALAAVTVCSVGTMTAATVAAADATAYALSSTQTVVEDGVFMGIEALLSAVTAANPVAGVIASGVFGAFKAYYKDATTVPQPTNQDIVNLLNEISAKMDTHYNAQNSQLKCLESIEKLQSFSTILTSVKGFNERALGQISIFNEDNVCAQDYQNIIDCTVGNEKFLNDFMDLSTLIIDGQRGLQGAPSFMQYLEYSKTASANDNNAALVKADCNNFNRMTIEQYSLYFTNLITGMLAKYNLAEFDYQQGNIDLRTKESKQNSIKTDMILYFEKAKQVADSYTQADNTISDLTVANVTFGGKTKEMFSFGDAWVTAAQHDGTMQLVKDWKTNNLAGDTFYYKSSDEFKDGALYVSGQDVTLDLNGHSIIHSSNKKYDIYSAGGTFTLKDTSSLKGAVNGILATGGKVTVDGVTIRDSEDAGIRAGNTSLNIKNTTFTGNKNSAVVIESKADTTIDGCDFIKNFKSAVYNKDSDVTIKNCYFEDNRSDYGSGNTKTGGAIYNHDHMTINNCRFVNNKAVNGGAIYSDYSTDIKDCTFTGNTATENGGAVMFDYFGWDMCEIFHITNCTFTGNTATENGGAIYCDSMNYLNLKDVEITNNTAGKNGGGLYCQKGSGSSCDPSISGKITIIGNKLTNGTNSNAFLGENTTSKCIFNIFIDINPESRIGVTSPTSDKTLDICRCCTEKAYNHTSNIFSYDTNKYSINRYHHWYSEYYWVEIVKN